MKIAVIGAGPSGITAAKNLFDQGLTDVTVFDRGDRVGGNWVFDAESGHSSVFETTHIISSRLYSQYHDYPMPESYPDYPNHRLLQAYFQSYADHFGVTGKIRFQTLVEHCVPLSGGKWRVTSRHEPTGQVQEEIYDYLVVCNGHHWKPRWPDYPGHFSGQMVHSHEFKRAAPFAGKRVLVIGAGNSACDVAVETARVSARTDISMRRGYWIVPKFIFGKPADVLHNRLAGAGRWLPRRLKAWALETLLKSVNGRNESFGMQAPDHRILETHPTSNSELIYFIRHGEIGVKRDIARMDGSTVFFKDGTQADYDAIICCTGFWIDHPFFDKGLIDYSKGKPPLYLKMLPADVPNVAFIGLFQPFGCIWPASELQSKILARMLVGKWHPPKDLRAAIQHELDHPDQPQLDTARHTITVDYPLFRRRLLKELPKDYTSDKVVVTSTTIKGPSTSWSRAA
ncbi:MAG TPA: NAD(P)-binding domain-containing protein [Aquabacterium sp.]|nr:NAD(P)-binding domain-containing protein [Aquabacterium sp.]